MAGKELVSHQQQFVEEINYDEIETEQVLKSYPATFLYCSDKSSFYIFIVA